MFGVGMTPPKVLQTPYPWSSVIISKTFGAPFGGTTRGGHHGLESFASSLITPPNFSGGGGNCLPSIVVVALGEPSSPVTCCAKKDVAVMRSPVQITAAHWTKSFRFMICFLI